jgi:hypothetical protein
VLLKGRWSGVDRIQRSVLNQAREFIDDDGSMVGHRPIRQSVWVIQENRSMVDGGKRVMM